MPFKHGDKVKVCKGQVWAKAGNKGWGGVIGTVISVPGEPDANGDKSEFYFIEAEARFHDRPQIAKEKVGGFWESSLELVEKVLEPEPDSSALKRRSLP